MVLADIMIWPTVGETDFAWLVFFVLFMFFAFFIINHLFRKQKADRASHGFAYSEVIGRNFSPDEAKILKKFIDHIPKESREVLGATRNWKFLRKDLHDFLLNQPKVTPELAVRIFDRLFVDSQVDHSFHVQDLQVGEVAALLTDRGEELTRIAKNTDEDLLLSSPKSLLDVNVKNHSAKLYVFRPKQGGFYIPGIVIGCMKDAILFHINGKPEHAGHAHLMLQEKFQVEINNWPRLQDDQEEDISDFVHISRNEEVEVEEDLKSLEAEIRKRFAVKPTQAQAQKKKLEEKKQKAKNLEKIRKNQNIEFFCLAVKLSDRGFLFELPEGEEPEFWKRSEIWQAKFQMPGGRYIDTKGKILPTEKTGSRLIFKFIDMEESLRIQIYEDIKKFGGEREVLR